MANWAKRLDKAERRMQTLAPPALERLALWGYEAARAVLGEARVARLPAGWWGCAYWLLRGLEHGAPPAFVAQKRASYVAAPWTAPHPEVLASIDAWLASPAGQTRDIDPWYTLHHEATGSVSAPFSRALAEAWFTVTAQMRGWEDSSADEQQEAIVDASVYLAAADWPGLWDEDGVTRAIAIVMAETLAQCYRDWLHWRVEYCSVAVRSTPLPVVSPPWVQWAERIRQTASGALEGDAEAWDGGQERPDC